MSFIHAQPEYVAAAASDLARIGSSLSDANVFAAAPTSGTLPAGADEVSAMISALFSSHAQAYQALSAAAEAFHNQFVHLMTMGGEQYALAEAANNATLIAQGGLAASAPAQALFGALPTGGVQAAPAAGVTLAANAATSAAPAAAQAATAVATPTGGLAASAVTPLARLTGTGSTLPSTAAATPAGPLTAQPVQALAAESVAAEVGGPAAATALPAAVASRAAAPAATPAAAAPRYVEARQTTAG